VEINPGKTRADEDGRQSDGLDRFGGAHTVLAVGGWAPWAGKKMAWTGKPNGPASQFALETTFK
jgi:hypothetical protein